MAAGSNSNAKARVLLVKALSNDGSPQISPPIGLLQLAACLRRWPGCDVRIIDLGLRQVQPDRMDPELARYAPDLVGISALSHETRAMRAVAVAAKRVVPHAPVVLGGPHASSFGVEVLEREPDIDYLVQGEGEGVFPELVDRVLQGGSAADLPGVSFRRGTALVDGRRAAPCSDVDQLPLPAYDLVPTDRYCRFPRFSRASRERYMSLISSRGCPFRCIYCHDQHGKRFRPRSPESFVGELEHLHDVYGVRQFEIVDDVFNLDRERVLEICDRIIQSGMRVELAFPNGLRGDLLDEEQLVRMKAAGTTYLALAVETASPRLQKLIKKRLDLDRVRRNVEIARRLRIHVNGLFMLNLPTETLSEMRQTADYLVSSAFHTYNLSIAVPFRGTEMAALARELGNEPVGELHDGFYGERFVPLSDVAPDRINRLRREVQLRFYANPRRLAAILRDFPDKRQFPELAGLFVRRLFWRS
jgi:radical SAM superfamily enzyme YgiQ (UPF0313 family)